MKKIKCDGVNYRKGFIEVSGNIHEGFINLEVWRIHPDTDISSDMAFDEIPDEAFTSNAELELSLENAEELLNALKQLVSHAKRGKA